VSNECKANNALTVFKDAKVGARGTKALVACANSPRLNFVPIDTIGGCHRGRIKIRQN